MLLPSIFEDNLVDDFFNDMFTMPFSKRTAFTSPVSMSADVQEFDDHYQLDLELPGFAKEDIQAELKEGYLTISANRTDNKDEKDNDGNYIRRERYTGQCRRSFFVGNEVTQEDINASFENGVLQVDIPKKEAKPAVEERQYIAIQG